MYKIDFSHEFDLDLNIILDYVFRFTFSIDIVTKLNKDIFSQINSLQIFPHRYVACRNYRILIVRGKYRVFYEILEESKTVYVYRILSAKQDYENII